MVSYAQMAIVFITWFIIIKIDLRIPLFFLPEETKGIRTVY
jgi:hypothetical protein